MPIDPIRIHPYDASWRMEFSRIGTGIRQALGDLALRIDHIGSTAIEDLAAKPVIDVQIAVRALEPMTYREPLESLGYVWRGENPELTKRYFREAPGERRTHIHVRCLGSWHQQFALLFRDYLRTNDSAARRYESVKRELAATYRNDRLAYTDGKDPVIWEIMQQADRWAAATGWEPGPTDA